MLPSIHVNLSRFYNTATTFMFSEYHRWMPWIRGFFNMRALQEAAWKYKTVLLLGGAAIGVAGLIYKYVMSGQKKPAVTLLDVQWKTTLNVAQLAVKIPKLERTLPANVMLTFCIDTSDSMKQHGRIGVLKDAFLNTILPQAEQQIATVQGTKIGLNLFVFDSYATQILTPTDVASRENAPIRKVIDRISCGGMTQILSSLRTVVDSVKQSTQKGVSQVVVLLTDGEDNPDEDKCMIIQQKLASMKAPFFAVGIGAEHNQVLLQQMVTSRENGFRGTYINAEKGGEAIREAMVKIYQQTVRFSSAMTLTAENLDPKLVKVDGRTCSGTKGRLSHPLGTLSCEETLNKRIEIDVEEVKKQNQQIDLSKVTFQLEFTDFEGQLAKHSIEWSPNTIIDSALL
jgi:Mg-chelatase subunit ChlD